MEAAVGAAWAAARVEPRLPLRPGTTAAYFLRSFDRDAARELPTVDAHGMCFCKAPVYFISGAIAILSTLPGAADVDAYCHDGDLGKPRAERASGL